MKLTARTDIDAPFGFVYESLADHESWVREATARGLAIERLADAPVSGPGAGWLAQVPFRGKLVALELQVADQKPSEQLGYSLRTNSFDGTITLSVMALSARRTRLHMAIEISPRTVIARVLINTLRLAKGRAQARMDHRLAQMGGQIEGRWRDSPR